jgi:hypothetical protein
MKIKSETIFAWGIGISIIAASAFVVFGFVAWHWGSHELHQQQNPSLNDWGNYGSYLQGTTASLWALAGTFLIFAAFLAQKQQLKRQEVDLDEQAKQFRMQHESIKLQNFENSFFQLLTQQSQIVAGMRDTSSGNYEGRKCFRVWYEQKLKSNYQSEQQRQSVLKVYPQASLLSEDQLLTKSYEDFFKGYQHELGHYFRNLYHIIKFVNESDALKAENADADYKNRRRYTSLARAQLSAFELALLFYNGISPYSEKFKPLIEKFGLLENFDKTHLLNPGHENFYTKTAFE